MYDIQFIAFIGRESPKTLFPFYITWFQVVQVFHYTTDTSTLEMPNCVSRTMRCENFGDGRRNEHKSWNSYSTGRDLGYMHSCQMYGTPIKNLGSAHQQWYYSMLGIYNLLLGFQIENLARRASQCTSGANTQSTTSELRKQHNVTTGADSSVLRTLLWTIDNDSPLPTQVALRSDTTDKTWQHGAADFTIVNCADDWTSSFFPFLYFESAFWGSFCGYPWSSRARISVHRLGLMVFSAFRRQLKSRSVVLVLFWGFEAQRSHSNSKLGFNKDPKRRRIFKQSGSMSLNSCEARMMFASSRKVLQPVLRRLRREISRSPKLYC